MLDCLHAYQSTPRLPQGRPFNGSATPLPSPQWAGLHFSIFPDSKIMTMLYCPQPLSQFTLIQVDCRCIDVLRFSHDFHFLSLQIVPYFGVMFGTFEFCKRICLYQNGYIMSPLSYKLTPGVDQSLKPQELRELNKFFKTGQLKSKKPTL